MKAFLWQPGQGIDDAALQRMQKLIKRPRTAMGEAWFMGEERHLFHELDGDLDQLRASALQKPLQEIAAGISAFGPLPEWHDWYLYLLPRLVSRAHETYVESLLEYLVSGFISLYPNGLHRTPYPGFREDVLLTLGRCMMDARCWEGQEVRVGTLLHRSNDNPARLWLWWDASGDFSAAMFLCLKYLPTTLVPGWLESVLAIRSPHWRAQIMVWLLAAAETLEGSVSWPCEWDIKARPNLGWAFSHCLRPELSAAEGAGGLPQLTMLPLPARLEALRVFRRHFTPQTWQEWRTSIRSVSYLREELGDLPERFEALYVHPDRSAA